MRWKPVLISATMLAALVAVVQNPTAAMADSATALPLSGYSDMKIDPAHGTDPGHILVSGGNRVGTAGGVVETNLDGTSPTTIGSMSGAEGLALAPDDSVAYATQADSHVITQFTPTAPYALHDFPTGDTICPHDIAVAGDGNVWFSYGCNVTAGDLGVLNPTTGAVTLGLATGLFGRLFAGPILLENSPGAPNTIVLGEQTATGLLAVLTVTGTSATVAASMSTSGPADIAVAADGASFVTTYGGSQAFRLSTINLHSMATYTLPTGSFGGWSVAISPDGAYVAFAGEQSVGSNLTYTTYGPNSTSIVRTYLGNYNPGSHGAMGWADGQLVAIDYQATNTWPYLLSFSAPLAAPGGIVMSAPTSDLPGQPIHITGTLISRGQPVGGVQVNVSRSVSGARTQLGSFITAADGTFSFDDTPTVEGITDYGAISVPDETHQIAGGVATVDVARHASALTLTGPTSVTRAVPLTLTGSLTTDGAPFAGATLTVSKTSIEGTGSLPSVTTQADGSYTITNTPMVGGPVTFTVSYPGDASHTPATQTISMTVSRSTTTITITTDESTYGYKAPMHITAHLGTTNTNRTVTLYITQYGHAKAVLKTGAVDSHGNLVVTSYGFMNSSFSASFSGDPIYAPLTVSGPAVKVAGALDTSVGGYYGKSGSYYLFHTSKGAEVIAQLVPVLPVPGRHVYFMAQVDNSGKWVSAAPPFHVPTDSNGVADALFDGKTGYLFRIQTVFFGDAGNAGATGPWWYVKFTT